MAGLFSDIEGWHDVSIEHLVYAYRKAKADCYFDKTINMGSRFAAYESELAANLLKLLEIVKSGEIEQVFSANSEQARVVAKKLSIEQSGSPDLASSRAQSEDLYGKPFAEGPPVGHAYFSDADRAFQCLARHKRLVPEFRVVGDFHVEVHILSALWICAVGDHLDAKLPKSSFGARLRRVRPEPGSKEGAVGAFHVEALGSFQPYFAPYKKWRKGGLDAIRNELKLGRDVVALSLDLASYYHQIDPAFLSDPRFLATLDVSLTPWQIDLNQKFTDFLCQWSANAASYLASLGAPVVISKGAGIPIGLSATRLVSNVLLAELDRDVERGLAPIYYGRYVDDIFLVLRDPGNLLEARDVLSYIADRTDSFPSESMSGVVRIELSGGYQGESILSLQPGKQKTFFLSGQSGLDLLDSVEAQIRSVSSERRLMPSPENLSSMASAKVLSAGSDAAEEADTLRRADGLSVRRLSWALQLRAVEILARDLRQDDWVVERREFYRFSRSHILRPDKILDHFDYLPRLISLAVGLTDWAEARRLYEAATTAMKDLDESSGSARINGLDCSNSPSIWQGLSATLDDLAREAVLASIRWDPRSGEPHAPPQVALDLCRQLGILSWDQAVDRALALREADWARTPYKQHLRLAAARHRPTTPGEGFITAGYKHIEAILEFLVACADSTSSIVMPRVRQSVVSPLQSEVSLLPYVFPTRPYTTQEISALLPELCVVGDEVESAKNWARYTRALRGVWVWGAAGGHSNLRSRFARGLPSNGGVAYLGGAGASQIRLGISSLSTDDESWEAAASGKSDLGRRRYERLRAIVNQAVTASPRPDYLLLPELSVPERWIGTISTMLTDAGVGLIAGVDYQLPNDTEIFSSAVLVLSDTRLGYPATVEIRQVKCLPAPGEDKDLQHKFGRTWATLPSDKPVYIHNGFAFGVLICSELQSVEHRLQFQGDVDCLMILSWNRDIDTFAALVESTSLDVHASIALVNNRRFGDSRVRIPAKKAFARDVCRLRGGLNEHVVVVGIGIDDLRAFQSRAKRWPDTSDPYKPVPESFEIAAFRRTVPR